MKKRILGVILAAVMILASLSAFAFGAFAADAFTLTAESGKLDTNNEFVVVFKISGNTGVAGLKWTLNFDNTQVQVVSYEIGDWAAATSNLQSTSNVASLSRITYMYAQTGNKTNDGTLLTVKFKKTGSAETLTLTPEVTEAVDQTFSALTYKVVPAEVGLDPIEGVTMSDATFTYDGKPHSLEVKGLTSDMTVKYDGNGKVDQGTYTVTATVKQAGHKDLVLTKTLKINKATLTVTGLYAVNRVFDGTTVVDINSANAKLVGVVDGETITATYPKTGTVATADAGNGKAVKIENVTIAGATAGNYTLVQPTGLTVDIAALTVTFDEETKTFDIAKAKEAAANAGVTFAIVTDPAGYESYIDPDTGAISSDLPADVKVLTVSFGYYDSNNQFQPFAATRVAFGNNNAALLAYLWYINNKGTSGSTSKPVEVTTVIGLKKDAATIKYMDGRDGKFAPNEAATRYEVIKALNNVFDITAKVTETTLSDVDAEYKDLVSLFTSAGIINGYPSDNTFRGTKTITRAEFCKIVCIMLGLDVEGAKDAEFNDVKDSWAVSYINACAAKGYIQGKGEGRFAPDANITRAELATLVNRITGAVAGTECSYDDVAKDAWYFGAVAAAAK